MTNIAQPAIQMPETQPGSPEPPITPDQSKKTTKSPKNRKKTTAITFLIVGCLAFVAGVTMLILNFVTQPSTADAEYLVKVGTWVEKDTPNVIWKFTEIGKGTLTTDNHQNDYSFLWALDDKTMKVETNWYYNLEDEFIYSLNQSDRTLTLTADGKSTTFVPAN